MLARSLLFLAVPALTGCFIKPDAPDPGSSVTGDGGACSSPVSSTFDDMPADACAPWGTRIAGVGGGTVTREQGGLKIQGQLDVQFNDGCITQPFSAVNGASVHLVETPLGQGDYASFSITPNGEMAIGFTIAFDNGLWIYFAPIGGMVVQYDAFTLSSMGYFKLLVRNLNTDKDVVEGFTSRDGSAWNLFASQTYPVGLSRTVTATLAASGPVNSNYALFDDLNVKTCPPAK